MVTGGQSGDKVTNESLCETIKVICAGHLSLYVRSLGEIKTGNNGNILFSRECFQRFHIWRETFLGKIIPLQSPSSCPASSCLE